MLDLLSDTGTRFEFECYDTAHLYNLAHFLDRGLVKAPLFIQTVFGIQGGIGAHPDDVMHMKRTADRLFGEQYRWSVLGAGRNQMPIAAHGGRHGRQRPRRAGGQLWDGPGQLADSNAEQVRAASRRSSRGSASRSRRPTRRGRCWRSRAATRSGSDRRIAAPFRSPCPHPRWRPPPPR